MRLWFLNLRIGARLLVGIGLCFLVTAGIAWVALLRMDALRGEMARSFHDYIATDAANMAKLDVVLFDRAMQEVASGASIRDAREMAQNGIGNLQRDAHLLQKRTGSQTAQSAAKTLLTNVDTLTDGRSRVFHLIQAKKTAQATRLWNHEMEPQISRCLEAIDSYLGPTMTRVQTRRETCAALYADGRRVLIRLCGFAFCLGALLAILLTQSIKRGLEQTTRRLESLSQTELPRLQQAVKGLAAGSRSAQMTVETPPMQWEYLDEFGALAASLNQCIEQTQRAAAACADAQTPPIEETSPPILRMAA